MWKSYLGVELLSWPCLDDKCLHCMYNAGIKLQHCEPWTPKILHHRTREVHDMYKMGSRKRDCITYVHSEAREGILSRFSKTKLHSEPCSGRKCCTKEKQTLPSTSLLHSMCCKHDDHIHLRSFRIRSWAAISICWDAVSPLQMHAPSSHPLLSPAYPVPHLTVLLTGQHNLWCTVPSGHHIFSQLAQPALNVSG